MNSVDYSAGLSPYQLPIINNYVIPVPPPPQKGDKNIKGVRHGTSRGRRFRPTTAPNGLEQLLTKDSGKFHKPSLHSNASVTMIYLGKSVHLSHDDTDYRDEIKVYQQHCGGENLCVYKGKLLEGETFHFTSKRHHGFPFSLTFFLNGIQMDRLSSCCEYKHRKGARLGGKHGYFGFVNVDRASPCYRCIIAMGLDKTPSPPKKKMKEDYGEKQEDSVKDEEHNEPSEGSVEQEATKHSTVEISSAHGESQEPAEDSVEIAEEEREEETQEGPEAESEDDQENASKDEYDEDFEADEEKSDEKVNEEGQADDQMNGMSKSPSDDEKDNLDHEKESKSSSQKALQASDSEKDESDGYSNSDSEEDKQESYGSSLPRRLAGLSTGNLALQQHAVELTRNEEHRLPLFHFSCNIPDSQDPLSLPAPSIQFIQLWSAITLLHSHGRGERKKGMLLATSQHCNTLHCHSAFHLRISNVNYTQQHSSDVYNR
uniref:DUF4590 domain-containing protein n=1 Tax=Terrapene triunguis TaxID=2587831 RepID=A0A674IY25_9SAUR